MAEAESVRIPLDVVGDPRWDEQAMTAGGWAGVAAAREAVKAAGGEWAVGVSRPPGPDAGGPPLAGLRAAAGLVSAVVDGLLAALEAEGVQVGPELRRRAVNRLLYGVPYSPAEDPRLDL